MKRIILSSLLSCMLMGQVSNVEAGLSDDRDLVAFTGFAVGFAVPIAVVSMARAILLPKGVSDAELLTAGGLLMGSAILGGDSDVYKDAFTFGTHMALGMLIACKK